MLRCRRCRKGVVDSRCLEMVEDTIDGSAAVCSIWHMNIDMLPEWIMTSIHQAQWTVGKLNCQNCGARLGGFNFINRGECTCGRDATVHLNKSRVDQNHKNHVLIVQPRRRRPEKGQAGLLTDRPPNSEGRPELTRTTLDNFQLSCAAVMSHISPAETSRSLTDSENMFSFSPLYCISHRRRCSLEDNNAFRSSCFCPAGVMDESVFDLSRAGADQSTKSPSSFPTSQRVETDAGASSRAVNCPMSFLGRRRSGEELRQNVVDVDSFAGTRAVHEDILDADLFRSGRTVPDSGAEPEESQASPGLNRLSKREKNRLKSVRRKQRRRERWLCSQMEQEQAVSVNSPLLDSEEEDREGLTCAVCLDIYFSPHSCQPCGHIFCEPCLRTLARKQTTNTPCPLCRTLISHTNLHKKLNQTAQTFFPKVYCARKQSFQNAPCAKWPLPSFHKRFRTFWGYRTQATMRRRRWHFTHGGFTLDTLDFTDMRGWLFDIGLVIIYIHSVNWILAFLFLCFLMYYFFF
ncbi:E3 ubiquitin-protein ligase RNF180 [Channa argus]|uniref:E3 ubiquitin-protein ligase RNF180 n=1 Tax=Channa argus TaxID=215402 RepID=A0A6G1QIN7_CHAAH|nr:E3 ubiquitin-protein ligase RNF180 [Channa argus]